ncbi:unnamed protein product [Ectocarpus sp. 12 AP-2014]
MPSSRSLASADCLPVDGTEDSASPRGVPGRPMPAPTAPKAASPPAASLRVREASPPATCESDTFSPAVGGSPSVLSLASAGCSPVDGEGTSVCRDGMPDRIMSVPIAPTAAVPVPIAPNAASPPAASLPVIDA